MSNPFGGFGQQNVFGSGNQQQTSVFGQQAIGQSTSTTTDTSTTNVFGQNVSQTSQLFGSQPFSNSSTVPTSSLFGRSTVGQNESNAFTNQSDNNSSSGFGSKFGQIPQFGQTSVTSNVPGTSAFGSISAGTPFSSSPTTSLSVFGGMKQGSNLFASSGGTGSTTSTSPGIFGKTPASSSNLFSKPSTASAFTANSQLFGVKREPVSDSKTILEGQGTSMKSEPKTLFGKVYEKKEPAFEETSTKPLKSSVFGGSQKRVHEDNSEPAEKSSNKQSTGLFGKGTRSAQVLFGKVVKKDEEGERKVKQTHAGKDLRYKDEHPVRDTKSASQGLFGKPRTSTSTEGKGPGSTRLFGKSPVTRSTARRPSSSSDDIKPSVRRQISENLTNKIAIVCKKVPHKYNNSMFLKSHFKTFGEVTKVFANQSKMQATVHFKTHEDAFEAKRRGRSLGPDINPMEIFWSSYTAPGTPKLSRQTSASEARSGRSLKRTSDSELVSRPKRTTMRSGDPVNEELEGMLGTEDIRGQSKEAKRSPERKPRSPERRTRTISPTPTTSSATSVHSQMFQGTTARSTTERVQLLELRDKYIRQNRVKQKKDIETAKAFVGTCPDMCPEKERYDREDKRRLSYYEIIPGTENIPGKNPQVDHSRAVKEYLRSSPDQDEPLPHELRPIYVLVPTMTYLLSEIADRGEDGRWGDWFDFLWNRTRGIRKDITQQQLNDRDAVELIEKCARFHIYCSERLCEEDMHSFDAKINNENLTKCLQTLKEFYADLEKKHRIYCENEAEFRAYTVLMNLNEGDTLREVQQLRPAVRTSQCVKFALQTYFALNGNNYIKFFRLMKQASFNNACIMHRYFTQVRNKALIMMMKGYSMGSRPAQIPLNELVRLLGFENESEASEFCEHYGFHVTDNEVVLDRSEYIEPETAWSPRRSVSLIESRLMVTVGELMNGRNFDGESILKPVSSFDEYDRFYSSVSLPNEAKSVESSLQTKVVERKPELVEEKPEPTVASVQQEVKQKPKVNAEVIRDTARFLFWEVIDEMCKDIGVEVKSEADNLLSLSIECMTESLNMEVHEQIGVVLKEVFEEIHALKREQLQQELKERQDRVALELTDDLIYELVWIEAKNMSTIKMREVKAQLKQECIERSTDDINKELINEVMEEMIDEVSEDVFDTDVRQRLKQLDDFEKIVKLSRTRRFWSIWKKEYSTLTKLKRAMEEFPCAPNFGSNKEVLKALIPVENNRIVDNKYYISKRARVSIETPLEAMSRHRKTETYVLVHDLYSKLMHETTWAPLDLGKLVGKQLSRKHKSSMTKVSKTIQNLSWKLLVCLPEHDEDTSMIDQSDLVTNSVCKWLKAKLSKGTVPTVPESSIDSKLLSLYKCYISEETKRPVRLSVCVRTIQGILDDDDISCLEEDMLMYGTSALLFVIPAGSQLDDNSSVEYNQYWTNQHSRLKSILQVNPKYQKFPLVVLIPLSVNQNVCYKEVQEGLNLDELIDEELLCEVKLVTYQTDPRRREGIDLVNPSVSEEFCESIQWLADHQQCVPELEVKYLKDVLRIVLQKYYFFPTQQNMKKRKQLNALEKDPDSLLLLYNNVITHIGEVLTSDMLYTISWPVYEFTDSFSSVLPPCHWNKGDHLEYIFGIIKSLKLPELSFLSNLDNWTDTKEMIWKFVSSVADNDTSPARVILFSRLKKLLWNLEVDFEEACNFQYGGTGCLPTYHNIPWTTVISMCIDYKLDNINLIDPDTNNEDGVQELKVGYIQEEMERFVLPDSWKYIESDADILDTPSLDDTIQTAVVKSHDSEDLPHSDIVVKDNPADQSVVVLETRKTADSLKEALKTERRHSDHFMKYLENAMKEGEMDTSGSTFSVFDSVDSSDRRLSLPSVRRKSDVDLMDLSQLPHGKRRRTRLSEVFNNDPVMTYLHEPSLVDELDNVKETLKSERRQSDLFTQRLQLILQSQSDSF
ncbi:Germinal-center associated nuclear protein [Mactra antiquata]